jgi:thiamine-phosphate pyrophosphorylase
MARVKTARLKMKRLRLPRVYPVTDARLSGLSHAEQVRRLCEGGARFVQVREKHAPPREFLRAAREAVEAARAFGALVIVNDRADIALAAGADGVHLGQDDLDPAAARRLLGPGLVIGYSTHSLAQALAAARLPVDYVALGPVFPTRTKGNPDPVVGLETLARVRGALDPATPLVAIGGITHSNARAAVEAGADAVALVGALVSEPDAITARVRELIALL